MDNFINGRVVAAVNTSIEQFKTSPFLGKVDYEKIEVIHTPGDNDMDIEHMVLIHLRCNRPKSVNASVARLHACPFIVFVEPNFIGDFHRVPNDPLLGELYGMNTINASAAWHCVTGHPHALVGVLDSGVDDTHLDLIENLRIPSDPKFNDIKDFTGHGTHVAGTIGAVGNNRIGITGVCWHAGMIVFKVGDRNIDLASAITAIHYATINDIPILNCSWGGRQHSEALRFAIQQYKGLVIASAGNTGTNNDTIPMYPASYRLPNIISVAATDQNNRLTRFSNYGERNVHIAAPGADILSTAINNKYEYKSGTSMATPHVTGAAVLLKVFKPNLTTTQMRSIILSTATRTPETDSKVSTGILNVGAMIDMARNLDHHTT